LALVGIIGGVALGFWVLWLLIVRISKLKANVASDGTSESAPLLNPDQIIRTDLQVRNSMASPLTQCSGLMKRVNRGIILSR